jgi:CRISPR-associated protein Csy1
MADARIAAIDAALRRGDVAGAKSLADALIATAAVSAAARAQALLLRSRAHEAMRNLAAAIADVEGALALTPHDARACNELGILCADAQQLDRAIDAFTRATRLDPRYARAFNNLGNALRSAGRVADAAAAFLRATEADPRYPLAWANLGVVYRDLGRDDDAASALQRAIALDPRQRLALTALAGVRRAQGAIDEAAALYRQSLAIESRDANSWLLLAGTLAERDELEEARRAYREAETRDPKLLRALFGRCLVLPMVPASEEQRRLARERFAGGLEAVERELPARAAALAADAAIDEMRWTNFLLAYHGEDDRELQRRFAGAVGGTLDRVAPQWRAPLARRHRQGRRLRVGFISAFFREGTVGRYFEHWITDLPEEIEVFVYHLQPGRDALAERLAARADHFRECPRLRPSQVAAQVRTDALDVVVYPELGMDATTFAVAALRLAPLQCAAWGHPVTTGHATIDVFFSSAAMEPAGGDSHYTERLVRLPGIGTRYARPVMPAGTARVELGLPVDVPLFLWPQSLFKIAPDDDALLARVLSAVADAHVVMFEGRHRALTATYVARLSAACARADVALGDRLHVVPQCRHDRYLAINLACDAMLDTLRWSGGNTTLDAIACALPVITLPGTFMRARQSAGMLTLAGEGELVAAKPDDYVAIAARLARDRGWRDARAARLAAGGARIFDDREPVQTLARWLLAQG